MKIKMSRICLLNVSEKATLNIPPNPLEVSCRTLNNILGIPLWMSTKQTQCAEGKGGLRDNLRQNIIFLLLRAACQV